jgi:hypothetical protein
MLRLDVRYARWHLWQMIGLREHEKVFVTIEMDQHRQRQLRVPNRDPGLAERIPQI